MMQVMRGVMRFLRMVIRLFVTLGLVAACLYVDARYIEPKLLKIETVTLTTDKLHLTQPLKIVQFSDVHLGEYYTLLDCQKVIDAVNDLKPDLVIFTGDLIDDNKTFQDEEGTINFLQQLESRYGKYAVYGNHDHGGNGTRRYARIMKKSGFRLLKDEQTTIKLENGDQLTLIGLDDVILSRPNMAKAFKNVPEAHYKLFLSHAPDVADQAADYGVDLQLSGHTHGGQIRLPLIGAPFTPPYGRQYVKGLYTVGTHGMKLYVNSGIGTSQLPYRLMNKPEVTMILLKSSTTH